MAALAGNSAWSPLTNFAYGPGHVSVGDVVTLQARTGNRPNLNCNDAGANIRTTEWRVSTGDLWYTIPNGYKGGEEVEVVAEAITRDDSELADKEVQIAQT